MSKKITVTRNEAYGHIAGYIGLPVSATSQAPDIQLAKLIKQCVGEAGPMSESYVDVDRKHRGSALNHDMYDVVINNGKVRQALVQERYCTCTKYGNAVTKEYFLLTASRGKVKSCVMLDDSTKRRVVKMSRTAKQAGEIIEVLSRHIA